MGRSITPGQQMLHRARAHPAPASRPSTGPGQTVLQKIGLFLGLKVAVTRPASARDSFSKNPPSHVYSPARLAQLTRGTQQNLRPSDAQLVGFCNTILPK